MHKNNIFIFSFDDDNEDTEHPDQIVAAAVGAGEEDFQNLALHTGNCTYDFGRSTIYVVRL